MIGTQSLKFIIRISIFLLFTRSIANSVSFRGNGFVTVRDNVRKIMLWPNEKQLPSVLSQALGNLSKLNPTTCTWPDLNYSTRGPENWDPILHMFRVSTMTAALTVPGGLNEHRQLTSAVHCTLRVWLREDWQNPNWWWNYIQDPLIATGIMLMLGVDRMTEYEIDAIVNMSYRADWWIRDWTGGANLVWELQVQLYRGLATYNYSAVDEAFWVMWETVQVQNLTKRGIQTDWSYHYHGHQLLSAAYGDAWATIILQFHLATRGTRYALPKERVETFGRFLTQGDAWFTMGSVWTWGIIGRVIDRGVHVWYTHLFPSDQLRALSMDVIDDTTAVALQAYAGRLEHRRDSPPLVGNRHFYTSDFQVHRRASWTAALKMHSTRTVATECYNGENLKGEHIADGVLNLYTRDAQYGGGEEYENIFALFNWQRINGITVEADTPLAACPRSGRFPAVKRSFVGGVSDGQYGAAVMDTATHNLTAKRTWHFYDDYIVALANGIEDPTPALLQTTLVSRLLPPLGTDAGTLTVQWSNGTRAVLPDGVYQFSYDEPRVLWFHADGTAWTVLEPYQTLLIDCRNKSYNVNRIGPWDYQMSSRMLTATIVHGRGPTKTPFTYKYMIMPNVTVSEVSRMWQHYMVVGRNARSFTYRDRNGASVYVHGTCDPFLSRASVFLFDQASANKSTGYFNCFDLSVSVYLTQAGGILFHEDSRRFTVTAAHPTVATGTFVVEINRPSVVTSQCSVSNRECELLRSKDRARTLI